MWLHWLSPYVMGTVGAAVFARIGGGCADEVIRFGRAIAELNPPLHYDKMALWREYVKSGNAAVIDSSTIGFPASRRAECIQMLTQYFDYNWVMTPVYGDSIPIPFHTNNERLLGLIRHLSGHASWALFPWAAWGDLVPVFGVLVSDSQIHRRLSLLRVSSKNPFDLLKKFEVGCRDALPLPSERPLAVLLEERGEIGSEMWDHLDFEDSVMALMWNVDIHCKHGAKLVKKFGVLSKYNSILSCSAYRVGSPSDLRSLWRASQAPDQMFACIPGDSSIEKARKVAKQILVEPLHALLSRDNSWMWTLSFTGPKLCEQWFGSSDVRLVRRVTQHDCRSGSEVDVKTWL